MSPSSTSTTALAARHLLGLLVVSALAGLLLAGLAMPMVGVASVSITRSVNSFAGLPANFQDIRAAERSVMLDNEGKPFAQFFDENRINVPLDKMSVNLQHAIVAIEDNRFYEHGPIDVQGTTRALVRNAAGGGVAQGGSTLTQQFVKNVLVQTAKTPEEAAAATEVSYSRKLRELRLAIVAEQQMSKDEILAGYLNIAYFGGGAYGVEAAARHYFSRSAASVNLQQAAMIAGMVQAPSQYDPERNPDAALTRRNVVLGRMAELGYITTAQADAAKKTPLGLKLTTPQSGCTPSVAPFFCDYVYAQLMQNPALGKTREERNLKVKRGGLRIQTTLDIQAHKSLQSQIAAYVDPTDPAVAAAALVEPGTGRVLTVANSRGYGAEEGQTYINYSVDMRDGGGMGFQAGSTFKPFVMAAAIEEGIPITRTYNSPNRIDMRGYRFRTCEGSLYVGENWQPKNYDRAYGNIDMRVATWSSVNTYYVQLTHDTGLCTPTKLAAKLGVTLPDGEPIAQVPSLALGPNNVSPLAMAEAYAAFAANGIHCNAHGVDSLKDAAGKVYPTPDGKCSQAISRRTAQSVTGILANNIDGPYSGRTGAKMSIGRPAAGKTGTTDGAKAVWFTGYTPERALSVVIGDPDAPIRTLDHITLGGVYYPLGCGSCIPGPIWRSAMSRIMSNVPYSNFNYSEAAPGARSAPTAAPRTRTTR